MNRTPEGDEHGYVGQLIDPDWSPDAPVADPITPPTLPDQQPFPQPGIYFGLSEEDYHAVPALSSSGIKKFSVSSMNFWANSWLNPDREERRTRWLDYGKAIHCFVLEGEGAYLERYTVELDPEDFEGALHTADEIKAAISGFRAKQSVQPKRLKADLVAQLEELGRRHGVEVDTTGTTADLSSRVIEFVEEQPVQPVSRVPEVGEDGRTTMRAATKEDWIDQLLELDPDAKVWDRIVSDYMEGHEGKTAISLKDDHRIRIAARMITHHPEIGPMMAKGLPEVSIFWHCRATGVPMKARLDLLKLNAVVDLKSFSNKQDMPVDRAIEKAIANYGYNIQHCIYDEAVMAARALVREHGADAVFQPKNSIQQDVADFCHRWAQQEKPTQFVFVFQQSGVAPVTRGKRMPRGLVFSVTRSRIEMVKRQWAEAAATFGVDPWIDGAPIEDIDEERIPSWATEIGRSNDE